MYSLIKYSILISLLWIISCSNPDAWDCVKTAGKTVNESREPGSFSKIFVYDKLNLELVQSGEYRIEIEAGENLLKGIETKIENGRLSITNRNNCELLRNSDKVALVRVYFDTITNLEMFNSGYVRSEDTLILNRFNLSKRSNGDMFLTLKSDNVFIYSNEYGDAIFNGQIRRASVEQEGVGLVDFSACDISESYVTTNGPGTTKMKATQEITGIVSGNGRLIVSGNPDIRDVTVLDEGELIFLDP